MLVSECLNIQDILSPDKVLLLVTNFTTVKSDIGTSEKAFRLAREQCRIDI